MNALNTLSNLKPDTLIANPVGEPVVASISVPAEARDVWKIVGNFGGFAQFIPAIANIDVIGGGPGSVRFKRFKEGGHVVIEQLNAQDDKAMFMTWTTIYNSLGIRNLWASMTVVPTSNGSCLATWTIIADPVAANTMSADEFRGFLQGFADSAMSNVPALLK